MSIVVGRFLITVIISICKYCVSLFIADFLEDFGYDRDTPSGEWHRGYIGLPSQRKTSSSDVKERVQHGREAEEAQSSFCNTEKSGSTFLKG